jgi:hypothetical protein
LPVLRKPKLLQQLTPMKVFITKYALTKGIFEEDARLVANPKMCVIQRRSYDPFYLKPHWHLTIEEAKAQAEKMRVAKIKSLQKSIDKLKVLQF